MVVIDIDKKIKALNDSLNRLETFLLNGDISLDVYYSKRYYIEYELEFLCDI
jgi:hypothetical protein